MKTLLDELKEELEEALTYGSNPFIHTTIELVIDMVESKINLQKDYVLTHKNEIDALPNNDKLGEYVRSLRNNL